MRNCLPPGHPPGRASPTGLNSPRPGSPTAGRPTARAGPGPGRAPALARPRAAQPLPPRPVPARRAPAGRPPRPGRTTPGSAGRLGRSAPDPAITRSAPERRRRPGPRYRPPGRLQEPGPEAEQRRGHGSRSPRSAPGPQEARRPRSACPPRWPWAVVAGAGYLLLAGHHPARGRPRRCNPGQAESRRRRGFGGHSPSPLGSAFWGHIASRALRPRCCSP